MRVCVGMRHGEGRERVLWDVVVSCKSLAGPSEGLDDGNGEVGEPSVLVFRGSEFWLRTYRDARCESRTPQIKGSQGNSPPKKV